VNKSTKSADKPAVAKGVNSDKKTEMTEKAQLVEKLQQQIKNQDKTNAASKKNLNLCILAAFFLAILLAVQVVNSNTYLKQMVTWKNASE